MNSGDFSFYQKMLLDNSGHALSTEKAYLLQARLTPIAQSLGYEDIGELASTLRQQPDPRLVSAVVEAMMTNETYFFRDAKPFQFLKDVALPSVLEKNRRTKNLRIWSAACSTGQEAYSIAITVEEFLSRHPGWKAEILATDISDNALNRARNGTYSQFEIQRGLPIQAVLKHFVQKGTSWQANEKLKSMIRFSYFNLLNRMDVLGSFDIIFCRNVMIYFSPVVREDVLCRLSERLAPQGHLFLGTCEGVMEKGGILRPLPEVAGVFHAPGAC